MLKIKLAESERYIEATNEFISIPAMELSLEHSLLSVSEWEAKYCKPFFSTEKTTEELSDYIAMMIVEPKDLTTISSEELVYFLTTEHRREIQNYISSPMTATTFRSDDRRSSQSREFVTSELVYYWMTVNNIPFSCETWPINRLLTLIRICGVKNSEQQKKSSTPKTSTYASRKAANAARRAKYGTSG